MKSLLIIGYVWPEPKSSAAGTRMLQLIKFFKSRNYYITFATTSTPTLFSEDLNAHEISTCTIQLNHSSFDDFIKELNPEIVLFDRYMMEEQFGWRLDKNCPAAIKILDTEDLHFLRKYREYVLKQTIPLPMTEMDLTKRELGSILRCDISLITSKFEYELLVEKFNISPALLLYIPLLYNLEDIEKENQPGYLERKHFFFIGNFKHPPNVECVKVLKTEIWPKLSLSLPEAELHIYGGYPTQQICEMHNPSQRFLVMGRTEDASLVFRKYKILLSPLRFGAGLKGKLLDAMFYGIPSVTTQIGAEGISGEMWNGVVEDDYDVLINKSVELYRNQTTWENCTLKGFSILRKNFSEDKYFQIFWNEMDYLKQNLEKNRKNNMMGNLLKFHNNNASLYLSKYIEVKNELEQLKKTF